MEYLTIEKYLRNFRNDEPPYDPLGAVHLLKAILDNMQENFEDYDFEDCAHGLDQDNEEFLKRLIVEIPKSRQIEIERNKEWEEELDKRAKQGLEFLRQLDQEEMQNIQKALKVSRLAAVKYIKEKYGLNLGLGITIVELLENK